MNFPDRGMGDIDQTESLQVHRAFIYEQLVIMLLPDGFQVFPAECIVYTCRNVDFSVSSQLAGEILASRNLEAFLVQFKTVGDFAAV